MNINLHVHNTHIQRVFDIYYLLKNTDLFNGLTAMGPGLD